MTNYSSYFKFIVPIGLLAVACGSAPPPPPAEPQNNLPKVRLSQEDFFRTELVSGEFTNEVDKQRYRATGDVLTEFSPRAKVIYFVGRLKRVPTNAIIKVKWFNNHIDEPQVVTDVYGSDSFSFVSTFTPPGRRFISGQYTARVYVNDIEVGSREFTITGSDPFAEGLKVVAVKVAKKVNRKGQAIKPTRKFKRASRIYAVFNVKNAMNPADLKVLWYRGDNLFNESHIHVNGNGRYNANIASSSGLPNGTYTLRIENDGVILKEVKFTVGNATLGPAIDHIALGDKPGQGAMPRPEMDKFRKGIGTIHCGLRFLDLPPNSEILIEWVMVDGPEESTYYKTLTPVVNGGSGTMSAMWSPGEIYPGQYKAVVYINDEPAAEKAFSVQ